jgi:hypothetical protein
LLFLLCFGCLEPYSPAVNVNDTHSLVIDGYIDASGVAIIKLSRSVPIYSSPRFPAEPGAIVSVESSSGETFSLIEGDPGVYTNPNISIDRTASYKLHVRTSNNHEYESDDVQIHATPTIAKVYYDKSATGDELEIKTDTRDVNSNTTGYYAWESIET